MKERKTWTTEEDQALKYLIEERGMTKWSLISETMQKQFDLPGRNGKQCRERYHNHLDKNISSKDWTVQEEDRLFDLQDKMGNKWALISSKLPGRSDNCVKNHFYSKLRKALRKINKQIKTHLKKQYKDVKTSTLYKVIETMENSNKLGATISSETVQLCRKIKNQLRRYEDDPDGFQDQQDELTFIRTMLEDIAFFDKDLKKNSKKGNLKNSAKFIVEDEYSPSNKSATNVVSTKSVYDDEESQYSNSDIFSNSSFDHKSFCSNRSQRLLRVDKFNFQSMSIASASEDESEGQISAEEKEHLYKSARLKGETTKQPPKASSAFLSASLSLPTMSASWSLPAKYHKSVLPKQQQIVEDKRSSSCKSRSDKENDSSNDHLLTYKYMMEGEQPFAMRLLSPKKLTIQEKMQMNGDQDDLFYGANMEIEDDNLIMKMEGMNINGIPKLGHSMDI